MKRNWKQAIRGLFFRLLLNPLLANRFYPLEPKGNLGDFGENLAYRHLLCLGWIVLERHYQDKLGEIDLIGVDAGTLVFVEVKTRSDQDQDPSEAVDQEKQRRITRTAKGYLKRHNLINQACRFDVIAIVLEKDRSENGKSVSSPAILRHYRSAFEAEGDFQIF
jgi:putative endonuclease